MLRLSEMNELAAGARSVGRDPVKTQFTEFERGIVKHFFFSQTKRDPPQARELDSDRMQSFFALCTLLGEPLDASKWPLLENAAKGDVRLDFLVGKDEVVKEEPNDWCCQVERRSATIRLWNQAIEVIVSRLKSSVVPSGSTTDSHSAFETSKICCPNEGSSSPTRQSASGV